MTWRELKEFCNNIPENELREILENKQTNEIKTAIRKSNEYYPNISFIINLKSKETFSTNEIRKLERIAFLHVYNECYRGAKSESIENRTPTKVQISRDPAIFKVVDKDGKTLFIGNEDDCKFLFPNCRNI